MISVLEADKLIQSNLEPFPTVTCPIGEAEGRVLDEDIVADRDQPPFNRITMDGIAISIEAWQKGQRRFEITGLHKAGQPQFQSGDTTTCCEVMTGAVLPPGSDCVIPYEEVIIDGKTAVSQPEIQVTKMQHVHRQGSSCRKGKVVIKKGTILLSPQISTAASVGRANLQVSNKPTVAIVCTGSELVDVADPVQLHQIRQSNGYAIQSALRRNGLFNVKIFQFKDDRAKLTSQLKEVLEKFDVLISSGGVSKGKFDFVPAVLEELGAKKHFHRVSQKPGKPFWFGTSASGKPIFALPGNAISSLICFHRFVWPALYRTMGFPDQEKDIVILKKNVDFDPPLTFFLPVEVSVSIDGNHMAKPMQFNTSGDFISLAASDGFIELPASARHFPAGYKTLLFRWI